MIDAYKLKDAIGPRPTMPVGFEDELSWRHGACYEWDLWIGIIDRLLAGEL